jgi:hypothetical protein
MVARKPRVVGFTPERGRRIRKQAGGVHTSIVSQDTRPRGSSSGLRFYRLMEDVSGNGLFYAKLTDVSNTTPASDATWTQVRNWDTLLNGALAGSRYLFGQVDGEWVVVQGNCVTGCTHAGTLTVGTAPDGEVGTEYAGHTITISGVSSVSATGLPPGLSYSAGEITGTPTEAGTFHITITGTAAAVPGPGNCTLTRVLVIVITPEPEE